MDRRGRRDADSRKSVSFLTWGGIILIAVVAFIVAYVLYSNNLSTQAKNKTIHKKYHLQIIIE